MINRNGRAKPLPYQKEGVEDLEDFDGRALLADEMGLGKTLQALWFIRRQRVATLPAIVVCPASVKYNWEYEAARHVGLRADVLEGQTPRPTRRITQPPQLTVINYDILRHWLPYLQSLGPTTIILDECQFIQSRSTQRTRAVRHLCEDVRNVIGMSGTPLTNRPSELWPALNIIRPDLYPSFFSYAQEYCQPRKAPWGWEYKGATNLDKLHAELRRKLMVRRLKVDVLKDLPSKLRRVVPMSMSPEGLADYNHANTNFRSWLKQHRAGRYATATKAEQLAKIGYLLRLAARHKARSVVAWANHFLESTDEKLVLFAIHKKMIDVLARRIPTTSVVVDGSVTGRKRDAAVQQFRTDPATRLFIGNIKAAGTGINGLQDAASTMAFAEMWWRPGDHVQAEDRLHRIGQGGTTWINYLVAGGTIEERLCEIIQEKQVVLRATLDGGKAPAGDLDVLDQLIAALEVT